MEVSSPKLKTFLYFRREFAKHEKQKKQNLLNVVSYDAFSIFTQQ